MSTNGRTAKQSGRGHRPRAATVFAAAFIAGAAAAFGVNRALDVHLAQSKPQVESEPIFVALRSLPQGAAVTVWDVALRDWPKAMMPAAAMRPQDSFEGTVLKHPLREGQPLLSFQLVKAPTETDGQMAGAVPAALPPPQPVDAIPQPDLWAPGEQPDAPATAAAAPVAAPIEPTAETVIAPTTGEPTVAVAPPVEPATTAAEPEVVSVVQPAPTTDIEPPPAAAPQTQAGAATAAVRYLVVPERIAMQADRSFVAPAPTQPPVIQPVQQPQPVEQVKPQPQQVAKQPPPVREAPQSKQQRARTARQPKSTATQQQPSQQRPAANSQRQPTSKPRGNTSAFQSMFPNLSAGMTAVEEQLQKIKREREAAGETQDEQTKPPQRSARSF
jgi:hypothetical protein